MKNNLLSKEEIGAIVGVLAGKIRQRHSDLHNIVLVGIERRGANLARRLRSLLGESVRIGSLDINLYRDDWTMLAGKPRIGQSTIPCSLDEETVILVDDVLYTGRTVRAALDALLDYGRPKKVELLTLIDRGHRELPIQPDYTGRAIETESREIVNVFLEEHDGMDCVSIERVGNS